MFNQAQHSTNIECWCCSTNIYGFAALTSRVSARAPTLNVGVAAPTFKSSAPTWNVRAAAPTFKSSPDIDPGHHDIGVSEHEVALLSGFYPFDMSHILQAWGSSFYPFDTTHIMTIRPQACSLAAQHPRFATPRPRRPTRAPRPSHPRRPAPSGSPRRPARPAPLTACSALGLSQSQ